MSLTVLIAAAAVCLQPATTDGGSATVALDGTGISALLTASPGSLDFGNVLVGTSAPTQKFTLSNAGTDDITFGYSADLSAFSSRRCPARWPPAPTSR